MKGGILSRNVVKGICPILNQENTNVSLFYRQPSTEGKLS